MTFPIYPIQKPELLEAEIQRLLARKEELLTAQIRKEFKKTKNLEAYRRLK